MIKHLQKRTLNLIYWTYTIIFICSLLMTDVDNIKLYAIYMFVSLSTWWGFDERFNKYFE